MKKYRITCKDCGASRNIAIVQGNASELIDWLDDNPNAEKVKIISGRKRLDDNWGWQCICGNNDLVTKQEKKQIKNLQDPAPLDITEVAKNLIPQKPRFEMRAM